MKILLLRGGVFTFSRWLFVLIFFGMISPVMGRSIEKEEIDVSSQHLLKKEISINVVDVSLQEFLQLVNTQLSTPLSLSCSAPVSQMLSGITTNGERKSLKLYLDDVVKEVGCRYVLIDNILTIVRSQQQKKKSQVLRGIVVDQELKDPIIGATVVIKGTHYGVTTDIDGKFQIKVSKEDELVVSFVGKETHQFKVTSFDEVITINLKDSKEELKEVVVTGYVTIAKNSFTGNAKMVKGDELRNVSRTNVMKALQVFDPSFKMVENNIFGSDPNAVPNFTIRGRSSMGGYELDTDMLSRSNLEHNPNAPTFILDGFEVSMQKVYDLDVNRIESMTILKDAAATAMYGSRASNGVVVITTVAPKIGEMRVNYNFTGTLEVPDLSDYNLMTANEKLEAERLAGVFDPSSIDVDGYQGQKLYWEKWDQINIRGVETDWLAQPLKNAFQQRHSLNIESGNKSLRYSFDLSYQGSDGVMKGSGRDNIGAGFNLYLNLGRVHVTNSVSFASMRGSDSPYGSFSDYVHQLPYNEFLDEKGNYLEKLDSWQSGSKPINPLYEASLSSYSKKKDDEIYNNLQLRWNVFESLLLQMNVGVSKNWKDDKEFVDPKSKRSTQKISNSNLLAGDLYNTVGNRSKWNTRIALSYNKAVGRNHVNFNVNGELSANESYSVRTHYRGFASGLQSDINHAAEVYGKPSKSHSTSRMASLSGILNYSYNNIYLTDLSVRYEGSSLFGPNQQTAPYWAAGFGVNIHEYELMENSIFSRMKVRASYGSTGNVNFQPHMSHNYFDILYDDWYITGYGSSLYYLGNPDLKSENTKTLDLGVDISMFNDRLSFTASYYNKLTTDMINDVTIPSSSGFLVYKDNIGKTQNIGFEIDINARLVQAKNLSLSVWANFAHNNNTLKEVAESMKNYNDRVNDFYGDYDKKKNDGKYSRPFTKYEEGVSLTAIYGMTSLGIDPANGKEVFLNRQGEVVYDYDASQQVNIGDSEPKGQGAFGLNWGYKGLTLNTVFQYEFGGDRYNQTLVDQVENADIEYSNVDRRVLLDRWQKPGDVSMLKDIKDRDNTTRPSSRFIQKYNVLSLSSLSVQYEFPKHMVKPLLLERIRLEANCGEMFRWCTVEQERGLSYPFARNYNFTLMMTF